MLNLIKDVEKWFVDRKLDTLDGSGQLEKLQEEVQELLDADNRADEIDAVGDITVVLIGYCLQRGLVFEDCLHSAYNEIKDRKGKVNEQGIFVKEK